MPRIAVAILVVVTIGACIGINVVRYPVVWEMVGRPPHRMVAPQTQTPAPTQPRIVPQEVVDLRAYAPPMVHASSAPPNEPSDAADPPGSNAARPQGDAIESPTDSTAGGGTMHFISESARDRDPMAGGAATGESRPPSDWADSSAPALLPTDATATDAVAGAARPIAFGPATGASVSSQPDRVGASAPAAAGEGRLPGFSPEGDADATPWPAQLAPTLKLGAKPAIGDDAPSDVRDEPMVPILRPKQAESTASSSRDSDGPLVERLPRVSAADPKPPWSNYDRRPEISKAIYPTTGK